MKNSLKAVVSILFLALTVTPGLISCGRTGEGDNKSGNTSAQTSAKADETTLFKKDDLPANLDFEGKTLTVLYREEEVDEFYLAEQTGDVVDDAVYKSNHNVEDRLNVDLKAVTKRGNSNDDRTVFVNYVNNTVMSGDDTFQIIAALTYNMPAFIQNGIVLNLLDIPYLNFDQPWWVQDLVKYGTVGNKLYIASGDASLSLIKKTLCIYFNIDLLNSSKLENPYNIVKTGKWTKDKFGEMAKSAYIDLNGDGTATTDDQYGYAIYDSNHINMYIGAFDLQVTSKDDQGYPTIVFGNEKVGSAVEYLCKFFSENNGIMYNKFSDSGTDLSSLNTLKEMFTSGRLLFISAEFNNAITLYRDMDAQYGVLPAPKWDESQEGYYTVARNIYSSFSVPVTCGDTKMAGAVLEAIASENYRTLSPVYFETALKIKYSRDTDAAQMYDIIKNGMKFNFGYTYHLIVGLTDLIRDSVSNNKPAWSSTYAASEAAAIARVNKFIETVTQNDK